MLFRSVKLVVDADNTVHTFKTYQPDKVSTFELADLPKGIVIFQKDGQDAVLLISNDFDAHHGGNLNIHYLRNAITGEHRDFPVEINVGEKNTWQLVVNEKEGRRTFTEAFLKANKLFGKVIGIGGITVK